jgi:hypothetical protein
MHVLIIWDGKHGHDQRRLDAAMRDLGYVEEKPFTWFLINHALRDLEKKGLVKPFHDPTTTTKEAAEARAVKA